MCAVAPSSECLRGESPPDRMLATPWRPLCLTAFGLSLVVAVLRDSRVIGRCPAWQRRHELHVHSRCPAWQIAEVERSVLTAINEDVMLCWNRAITLYNHLPTEAYLMIIHKFTDQRRYVSPREDTVDDVVVSRTWHVRVDVEVRRREVVSKRVTVPQTPRQVLVFRQCLPITPQHWHQETLVLGVEYVCTKQLYDIVEVCVVQLHNI